MRRKRIGMPKPTILVPGLAQLIIGTALLAASVGQALAQSASTSWNNTGSLNTPRAGHTATLLPNGKVLVLGGSGPADSPASAELYDPATGKWSITGSLNVVKYGCATLLLTGKVLVVGGGSAELYDPSTGTFTLTGNMIEHSSCSTATLLRSGKVLITGVTGESPDGPIAGTPELYDPSTGQFTLTGRFADPGVSSVYGDAGLVSGPAILLQNGKVLFAAEPKAQLYDPVSGTFSLTGAMTTPSPYGGNPSYIGGRTATLLRSGRVLVTGGEHEDIGRFRSAELYDPSNGTFTATGDMIRARDLHTATLLPDGRVLITGGETEECSGNGCWFAGSTASAEIFDPSTGSFDFVGNMNARRELHTATLLNNGRVLITGGLWYAGIGMPEGSLASAEVHNAVISSVSNAIDDTQFFVRQQYLDFLNREPDQSGADFWINQITSCGVDQHCIEAKRINVSAAYFLSIEFQQTGYLVYRMHKAAYRNLPNAPVPIKFSEFLPDTQEISQGVVVGQTGWETLLENNKQAFINEFVNRPRFTTACPQSMSPAEFVDKLNANAGNPLVRTERDHLVSDLETGAKTRAEVLRAVAENEQFAQQEFNRAFVLMQYFGYLRRDPNASPDTDFSGYTFWLNKLDAFNGDYANAEMVKAFITSSEYRSRFGL